MIKLTTAVLALCLPSAAFAASLTEAQDAYEQNKVSEAERLFAAVAADGSASADDRADANLALARIAWLIDGNADLALQRADTASAGGKVCDAGVMRLRVLRGAKRDEQTIDSEPALLKACHEPQKQDEMRVHAIAARLDLADSD